jgi:hypothetical protein
VYAVCSAKCWVLVTVSRNLQGLLNLQRLLNDSRIRSIVSEVVAFMLINNKYSRSFISSSNYSEWC